MLPDINKPICRDNEQLSKYGDSKSARVIMLAELKKLIEANPLFRDKLTFPNLKNSRLRTLINQRLFTCVIVDLIFFSKLRYSVLVDTLLLLLQLKLAAPALQKSQT